MNSVIEQPERPFEDYSEGPSEGGPSEGPSRQAPSRQEPLPPTSLIIPSRNRPTLLLETVHSILEGNHVPTEIVIIDQSDAPNTALAGMTHASGCDILYKWSRIKGVSRARNDGIARAQYDVLAVTDDDVLVTPTWFGTLIGGLLAGGPRVVVTGQVRAEEGVAGKFAPSTRADEQPVVYEGRTNADVLFTNSAAFYRHMIEEIGGFDERLGPGTPFPAAEDNDLCFRVLEAGYRIIYLPAAILYHRAWREDSSYLPLRWNYGRGQGAFYAKYASLRDRYTLKRLWQGTRKYEVRSLRQALSQRRKAWGDALFVMGMYWGAASWLLTHRVMTRRMITRRSKVQ